jgi:hypothetical protein
MCESERLQNVKGCLFIGATDSPKTHRGEGESPTPLATLDECLTPYIKAYYKATKRKPHE